MVWKKSMKDNITVFLPHSLQGEKSTVCGLLHSRWLNSYFWPETEKKLLPIPTPCIQEQKGWQCNVPNIYTSLIQIFSRKFQWAVIYCFMCCPTIAVWYRVVDLQFKHHQMLFWIVLCYFVCLCFSISWESGFSGLEGWISLIQIIGFQDPDSQHKIFNDMQIISQKKCCFWGNSPSFSSLAGPALSLDFHFTEFNMQPISDKNSPF